MISPEEPAEEEKQRLANDPKIGDEDLVHHLIQGRGWENPALDLLLFRHPSLLTAIPPLEIEHIQRARAACLLSGLLRHLRKPEEPTWRAWLLSRATDNWSSTYPFPAPPEVSFEGMGSLEPLARELHRISVTET